MTHGDVIEAILIFKGTYSTVGEMWQREPLGSNGGIRWL